MRTKERLKRAVLQFGEAQALWEEGQKLDVDGSEWAEVCPSSPPSRDVG